MFLGLAFGRTLPSAAHEEIAAVDTYGILTVSRDVVLEAAGIRKGDRVPDAEGIQQIVRRLEAIPRVDEADVSVIRVGRSGTTPDAPAQPTIYIGIREAGRSKITFRAAPTADVTLPKEIVDTYEEFERNLRQSMQRGNYSEDDSNGYALLGDESTRAIQRTFVPLAQQYFDRLIEVLRTARSATQRRIAATVLSFADDKTKVAVELAFAARDPDEHVRNDAMRALGVIVDYAHKHAGLAVEASIDPYLDLLESVEWTDRNKAMFVLLGLTENCDDALLTRLARRSLTTLAEMARWNTEGHAMMAYMLVGRIAHMTEAELVEAWGAGKREEVIARALESAAESKSDEKPKNRN